MSTASASAAAVPPAPVRRATVEISHGLGRSLALHLAPGVLMLLFYVATAPVVIEWGFPPLFASLLTVPILLVPWMLGYLGYEARRRAGRFSPLLAIAYREKLSRRQYLALGLPLIAWGAVAFPISGRLIGPEIVEAVFGWLPAWFLNPQDLDQIVAMPAGRRWIFLGSLLLFAGLIAPVVEELYFRGHLLAGLARYGRWAPVLSTALFTLYHFESPWESPGRFLMVLPLVYLVWRKRSVGLGIAVHVTMNTLSAIAVIVAVALSS